MLRVFSGQVHAEHYQRATNARNATYGNQYRKGANESVSGRFCYRLRIPRLAPGNLPLFAHQLLPLVAVGAVDLPAAATTVV